MSKRSKGNIDIIRSLVCMVLLRCSFKRVMVMRSTTFSLLFSMQDCTQKTQELKDENEKLRNHIVKIEDSLKVNLSTHVMNM